MNLVQGLDLICMGRAAVDLYGEQVGASLEDTSNFSKYVGGCPANIAIGTARLGLKTAMLSRVGNEAMGRFVRDTFIREGIDVSLLQTDPDRLTGLVLLGVDPPDRFPLIFYREQCADMAINPMGFDEEVFESAKALLITGTHCSTQEMFAATQEAVNLAQDKDCKVIFDLDYRPVLWGATGHDGGEERYVPQALVCERYGSLFPHCTVIVGTEEEFLAASGGKNEPLKVVREKSDALIIQKKGERGCIAYPGTLDEAVEGHPYKVEVFNVLGAGDAFMSGFLRGYLRGASLEESLSLANANGALVVTRHGCAPAMPYWNELRLFTENPGELEKVESLHQRMQFREEVGDVCILAFDHRSMFEEEERAKTFKWLIYQAFKGAVDRVTGVRMGLITDEKYGFAILKNAKYYSFLTARCIEESGAEPLEFLDSREASMILRHWPKNHVVKVLSRGDVGTLKKLYEATRQTGHALLIEFIGEGKHVAECVKACYEAGVYPAWWKFPPILEDSFWKKVEMYIQTDDPQCNGVLLLGGNRSLKDLAVLYSKIKSAHSIVKGFAVGRSVWLKSWQEWKSGKANEEEVKMQIRDNFLSLVEAWKIMNQGERSGCRNSKNEQFEERKNDQTYGSSSPYFVSDQTTSGTV